MRATVLLFMAGVARAFVLPRAAPTPLAVRHVDAGCVEDESCSVEELAELLAEVKSKAAEIKTLESKLTALNKDDTVKLKSMLKAEECELNGFDGCSAWCVAPSAALPSAPATRRARSARGPPARPRDGRAAQVLRRLRWTRATARGRTRARRPPPRTPRPSGPRRRRPTPGGVRVLISRSLDHPGANETRPGVTGSRGA